ncbi:MAG: zinc ribbon domain-containing protein [Chloroflexota bacterium]|nr:zinc ribbon domain-containing protein [Chloroflexota bacterium]MDE2970433.1 zinc ribbon domain-containing protein [Chloroflexota bacterium]
MPLYEYHCEPCNDRFEVLRPMSKGNDPATCPTCGGAGRRVLSVFAAVTAGGSGEGPMPIAGGGGACCGGGGCGCH